MIIYRPTDDEIMVIRQLLRAYNKPHFGDNLQETLIVDLRPKHDAKEGGAYCTIFGDVLEIKYLAIKEDLRGRGLGNHLIEEIKKVAKAKHCKKIILNTYNFQAKGFYQKHGFSITHEVTGYPNGIIKYYMEKSLS